MRGSHVGSRARTIGVLALSYAIAACSGASPSVAPSSAPTKTSAASASGVGTDPLRVGKLPPGTYRTTAFEPALTFAVGDGWTTFFQDDEDEVALEHIMGPFVAMTRVSQVIDPATGQAVAAPDDLVAWFGAHPRFRAEPPEPAVVGGLEGRSILIRSGSRETETFAYPSGNMRVNGENTVRYYVLPMEGPDLTVVVQSPTRKWEAAQALVEPILASLEIAANG